MMPLNRRQFVREIIVIARFHWNSNFQKYWATAFTRIYST